MTNPAHDAAMAVLEAINSGDFSCLDDCVTADFVDHGAPVRVPPGPDGYRQVLTWVSRTLNIQYTLDELIETDSRIVIRATASGVATPPFHPPHVAGQPYSMSTMHVYRTHGNRLAEHWGVRDEAGAMVQLGVIAAPDPKALGLTAH